MAKYPKWATPIRRLALAKLALEYLSDIEGWEVDLETGEAYHPEFSRKANELIADWKADDREARNYELRLERRELHRLNERRPRRSLFDAEVFYSNQPTFYLEGLGVSADYPFRPIAKIRLASTSLKLFIDLSEVLKPLSKNQRRKALRHGKPSEKVFELISLAVKKRLGG